MFCDKMFRYHLLFQYQEIVAASLTKIIILSFFGFTAIGVTQFKFNFQFIQKVSILTDF